MHAGKYSYAHRRRRRSEVRKIWIDRINAAAKQNGMKYSELMGKLKNKGITLNKKMLADIALNNPDSFSKLVQSL